MRVAPFAKVGAALAAIMVLGALAARPGEHCVGSYATVVDGRSASQRHNAELSLTRLNGAVVGPGEVFSFNARVGTFSRDQGYRKAPVSYNGQLINSWGGGVCQTSTTLYNAALLAGMEIVERNRHRFAPSYVPPGRDAAVAFNTIDLKFRNPHPFPVRIEGRLDKGKLQIGLFGPEALAERPQVLSDVRQIAEPREHRIGTGERYGRIRNSGKAGFDVVVYRVTGDRKEMISSDTYPAMNRIVDMR